ARSRRPSIGGVIMVSCCQDIAACYLDQKMAGARPGDGAAYQAGPARSDTAATATVTEPSHLGGTPCQRPPPAESSALAWREPWWPCRSSPVRLRAATTS